MKNLKPEILRERLIIEGFYEAVLDEEFLKNFLLKMSSTLELKPIVGPLTFSPDRFSELHHGLGGFLAWAESGVAFYSWSEHKFFTLDIYSCKPLNVNMVLDYVKRELKCKTLEWQKITYEQQAQTGESSL